MLLMTTHPILTRVIWLLAIGLIAGIAPQAAATNKLAKESGFVYIASFNIYRLGAVEQRYRNLTGDSDLETLDDRIPQRIENLARVLAFGDFDLVAIQEIQDGYAGNAAMLDLVRALEEQHGLIYRYFLSEYIGRGFQLCEAMAFLYKPDVVRPEMVDGADTFSIRVRIPGRDIVRTQWEAGHFDFTMFAVHLAWSNHDDRRAGFAKVRNIFDRPLDWSADPDIIILGDFNRLGGTHPTAIEALPYDSGKFRAPNIHVFDSEFSKLPEVPERLPEGIPVTDSQLLSTTVSDMRHAYDMIMFSSDANEEFPEPLSQARYGIDFGIIHFDHPDGVGFQSGADKLKHADLKTAYSDHRPVWLRFRTDDSSFADD